MASHPHLQRLRETIWPPELPGYRRVYAIVDGAQDPSIYGRLAGSFQEHCCLYSGQLAPDLRVTAPYLVQLDADETITRHFLDKGWGRSWCVFLRSDESMEKLRRHLRRFLIVADHSGARLIFRYYDPRVLRVFLRLSTLERLAQFFGPIQSFLFEEAEGEAVVEYSVTEGRCHRSRVALSGAGGKSEPATLLGAVPDVGAAKLPGLMDMEPRMIRAFGQSARVNWIVEHLHEFFPEECAGIGRVAVRSLADHAAERAESHGFTTDSQICQYAQIAFVLGRHFDRDPNLPWVREILAQRPADPDIVIYELHQAAVAHLQAEEQPETEAAEI